MPNSTNTQSSLVLSYLDLRKAIGILGIALPFVLVVGKFLFDGPGTQPSISDYYYASMRDVFVGIRCAIGVFLMSYRGYERKGNIAGDLACVFAIGVALFPTAPELDPTSIHKLIGLLHFSFAAAFFLILAYFCLALFRKSDPTKPMTRRKRMRNKVYATCGGTILASLTLLLIYALFLQHTFVQHLDPVFWLETITILAFGISWLTKGEAILKDEA